MSQDIRYDRPNTVAGLVAKHAELTALRKRYREEIKKLTAAIDHVNAAIRLFDPDSDTFAIKEYVARHRSSRGEVKRFLLSTLRTAPEPMTSRQLAELWVDHCGLKPDNATVVIIRKRIGACILNCASQKLIECVGKVKYEDGLGPYNLWRVVG